MDSDLVQQNPRLVKLYKKIEDWQYFHAELLAPPLDSDIDEILAIIGEVEQELLSMGFKIATDEFYDKVILIPTFLDYPREGEKPEKKRAEKERGPCPTSETTKETPCILIQD